MDAPANLKAASNGWQKVLQIILPFLIVTAIFECIGIKLAGLTIATPPSDRSTSQLLIITAFSFLATFITVWCFRVYVDKDSFSGFFRNDHLLKHISLGLIIGFTAIATGFLLLFLTGQINYTGTQFNASEFLASIGIFVLVAFRDELFMRAYVLGNLLKSFNRYIAVAISSLFFGLMHAFNPHANWFSIMQIALGGVVLGLLYMHTKSLWLPISFHFSWNFFQATVFGFAVSGRQMYSIVNQERSFDNVWNGGPFGFEGSLIALLFELMGILLISFVYRHKRQLSTPLSQINNQRRKVLIEEEIFSFKRKTE